MSTPILETLLESILFSSPKPLSIKKLAVIANAQIPEIERALEALSEHYAARGIRLTLFEGQAQFVTSPQHTEVVKDFLKEDISGELTRAALETLAVIAYRGPVTKIEIEHVRGVNCSQSLRNLLIRGLIDSTEAAGEKKYILTFDFINHIGIQNIKDLPDYDALRDHARIQELLATDGKIESDAVSPNETV
jgi:segregation and condensation protein B